MSNSKKEEKQKYYFKFIPKEEFSNFIERLKNALENTDNMIGDKKSFELEIRGTKEELDGLSLEIFSFDRMISEKFIDVEIEYIKNALYCISLNISLKEEADFSKIQSVFEQFKPMLYAIPKLKDKFELYLRNKGKKMFFDIVTKDGEIVKALLDIDLDFTEFHNFNLSVKSGIDFKDILDINSDINLILIKICSLIFSIKSETENVKYLFTSLTEALKDIKLNDEIAQKKFNKFKGFLSFINSYIGTKIKMEYSGKELVEAYKQKNGGEEKVKSKINSTQQMIISLGKNMGKPMIATFGLTDIVKAIDFDYISLNLGIPKYQNGYIIILKIPGITKVINDILDSN